MSGHTPGPWAWNDDDMLKAANGDELIETDSGYYPPYGADRHLISAAPDLLEACRVALPFIDTIAREHEGMLGGVSAGKALAAIEAAITKAEGK